MLFVNILLYIVINVIVFIRIKKIMLMAIMDNLRIKKMGGTIIMKSYVLGTIVGRVGSLKVSDKYNRISVAVNYNSKGQLKCNWYDFFDFNHRLDNFDESNNKGKVISIRFRIHPTISKIGDVNVHNYILVLEDFRLGFDFDNLMD